MSASIAGQVPGSGGTMIAYQIDGPQGAPWLMMSNSLATDRRIWDPQIRDLTSKYRVVRYDTRGHGDSQAGSAPYNFGHLTEDVHALFEHLQIERADFIGISLGGMTGLAFAMCAPERVGRLVCCDARASAPDAYRGMWEDNIAKLNQRGIAGLVEPTLERWFTPDFMAATKNADTLATVRSMFNATSTVGYEGAARALQNLDMLEGLPSLQCKTLYIVGEADMAAPVAVMQDMADRTPQACLKILPNAAHLSNIEQPDAFNSAIRNFLSL